MSPSDPAVREFLSQSMVARIGALSPKGQPFITPLWFVCDRGKIHLPTGESTLAARYLSRNPAAVLLFDAERCPSGRVLRLRGNATVHRGRGQPRVLLRYVLKYYLSSPSRGLFRNVVNYRLVHDYYAQGVGAVDIEVIPEAVEMIPRVTSR